jgi:hypothetical protein
VQDAPNQAPLAPLPIHSSQRDDPVSRSISLHLQAQDFSWFAFDDDLKRAAADLAIRCETLRGDAGVNGQVKGLAAERALNGLGNLHESIYASFANREKIFREVFEQYWQYVQCMPGRNRHHLNAAWRLVVETWLRRQGWIAVRDKRQPNVSTNSKGFFSQN